MEENLKEKISSEMEDLKEMLKEYREGFLSEDNIIDQVRAVVDYAVAVTENKKL